MKPTFEQYDLIDRYLDNRLTGEERALFEQRLETDTALRDDLEASKAVNDLIFDQGLLNVKAKLKVIDASLNPPPRGISNYVYSTIAVITVATIGYLVWPSSEKAAEVKTNPVEATQTVSAEPEKIDTQTETPVTKKQNTTLTEQEEIVGEDAVTQEREAPIRISEPSENTQHIDIVDDAAAEPSSVPVKEDIVCQIEDSKLNVRTVESCNTHASGAIQIQPTSKFEGKLPITFSLNGRDFQNSATFNDLADGTYYLSVKDGDGCLWYEAKEIVIAEKNCREDEFAFFPDRGEKWTIPVDKQNAKLEIYNRNGGLVYSVIIQNGYPDTWDGTSDGQALPMGSYSYRIVTPEGVSTGFITILR